MPVRHDGSRARVRRLCCMGFGRVSHGASIPIRRTTGWAPPLDPLARGRRHRGADPGANAVSRRRQTRADRAPVGVGAPALAADTGSARVLDLGWSASVLGPGHAGDRRHGVHLGPTRTASASGPGSRPSEIAGWPGDCGVPVYRRRLGGISTPSRRDEPHYLVITQSLLRDGDLKVENNYLRREYREFYTGDLQPHYLRRGQNQEIYSIHAPGLPAVVAPVFALFGYPGVIVFLSLLSAAATALTWTTVWRVTRDAAASWFAWSAVALSAPFFFQAFTMYPDAPGGALLMVTVLALATDEETPTAHLVACGATLALLPWLHTRFAILASVAGAALAFRLMTAERPLRRMSMLLAIPIASALAWLPSLRGVRHGRSCSPAQRLHPDILDQSRTWRARPLDRSAVRIASQRSGYLCAALGLVRSCGDRPAWRSNWLPSLPHMPSRWRRTRCGGPATARPPAS